jgi:4-hydroxybenzoate polyprenyltransferase
MKKQWLHAVLQFVAADSALALFIGTMLMTFFLAPQFNIFQALYLGGIILFGWIGVDMINNIYDVEMDKVAHPARALVTEKLGAWTKIIASLFLVTSFCLSLITRNFLVVLAVAAAMLSGTVYSVPPFRLRQTMLKPVVNFTVGLILTFLVASFYGQFTVAAYLLMLLAGLSTTSASLWDDVIDYEGDLKGNAKTIVAVIGQKEGAYLSFLSSFSLIPVLHFIGLALNVPWFFYFASFFTATGMMLVFAQSFSILLACSNSEALASMMKRAFKYYAILASVQMLICILSFSSAR